ADALPFADDSFDAVICSEVLEHTRHAETVVAELRRVCKPGGLLYVTSPFAFPEHGVPYDFQRLTRYFYKDVFGRDEIVSLAESNSMLSTALTCCNMFIEWSPLRLLWGAKHVIYLINNALGKLIDLVLEEVVGRFSRSYRVYFYTLPLGYAMIVRV